MNAPNLKPVEPNVNVRSVKPGELFVLGKIASVDKFKLKSGDIRFRTRVLMKDHSDDFAYPMPVDIVGPSSLGAVGELWDGVVRAKTYRKDYDTRPDEDGVIKKIKKVELECYFLD